MNRVLMKTSNIVAVGHDPIKKILEIEFNGGCVYQYYEVPSSEHSNFVNSNYVWLYFSTNIKTRYTYKKI